MAVPYPHKNKIDTVLPAGLFRLYGFFEGRFVEGAHNKLMKVRHASRDRITRVGAPLLKDLLHELDRKKQKDLRQKTE